MNWIFLSFSLWPVRRNAWLMSATSATVASTARWATNGSQSKNICPWRKRSAKRWCVTCSRPSSTPIINSRTNRHSSGIVFKWPTDRAFKGDRQAPTVLESLIYWTCWKTMPTFPNSWPSPIAMRKTVPLTPPPRRIPAILFGRNSPLGDRQSADTNTHARAFAFVVGWFSAVNINIPCSYLYVFLMIYI